MQSASSGVAVLTPWPHSRRRGPHSYLGLLVVLHGHGDHVQPDDAGDEEVQVVAGAEVVDEEPEAGVVRVVGFALGFWWGQEESRAAVGPWSLQPFRPQSLIATSF